MLTLLLQNLRARYAEALTARYRDAHPQPVSAVWAERWTIAPSYRRTYPRRRRIVLRMVPCGL